MKTQLNYRKVLLYPITAALLFAGCVRHKNVIEKISDDKVLIRDIKTNQERVIEILQEPYSKFYDKKWIYVGDTVKIVNPYFPWLKYSELKVINESFVILNHDLTDKRKEQAKFDSLKNAMMASDTVKQK